MKKIRNILLATFIFFISVNLFASNLHFGPYLQSVKTDGITVLWRTTEPVMGQIIYGISPEKLDKRMSESIATELHKLELAGLKPNQKYFYQCIWENGSTEVFHFKTAPDNNETPFRINVIGDSRTYPETFSKICQQVKKYNPDLMIHSGDFVSRGTQIEQWKPQFFDPAKDILATSPLLPSLGNHEKKTSYFFEHFTIYEGAYWWSSDYGSVHFISLNTEEDCSPGSEQYKWLVEDLRINKDKKWKIIFFHDPLFNAHPTRPVYDIRYQWTPLFIEYGVDLVITGHDHYYHRTFPIGNMSEKQQGLVHITSAGGGAELYPVVTRDYTAYSRSLHHFMIIDVNNNQLNAKAISIDGDIFDTFSINKEQDFMPNTFVEYEMYELEKRVDYGVGKIKSFSSKDGEISFDGNAVIKTNFKKPVKGFYQWEVTDNWEATSTVKGEFSLNQKEDLIIPVKFKTSSKEMVNSPKLYLHIEGDNSGRNTMGSRPYDHLIGFKNQTIRTTLEDAIFSKIKTAKADDVDVILNFIKHFHKSERVNEAIDYLGVLFSRYGEEIDTSILDRFLEENGSEEIRYWCYPLYFATGNYNDFEEWFELAKVYAPYKKDLSPNLFSSIAKRVEMNTLNVQNWWIIGPFPNENNNGLNVVFDPEKRLNLSKSYKGIKNIELKWERKEADRFGYMDLFNKYSPNLNVVNYSYTTIETDSDGEVLLLFGSDDGAVIWVNGKEYMRKNIGRSAYACNDLIPVSLKKGKNEILVKVAQGGGEWEFYFQIIDKNGIIKR